MKIWSKMEIKDPIFIFILFIILIQSGTILVENPSSFSFAGFTWDLNQIEKNEELYNTNIPSEILASDIFSVNNLKPRQQIYETNEQATIDFYVQNKLNEPYPYNITVHWIHDNEEYYKWMHESNDSDYFNSYYSVNSKGVWEAQVVLKWKYLNVSYSKDNVTSFKVI